MEARRWNSKRVARSWKLEVERRVSSTFHLPASTFSPHQHSGFTLAEVALGGAVLFVAVAAILGAYVGQVTLNEHARNLTLAIQDANRVVEQIRQDTASCGGAPPKAAAPGGFNDNWNGWLGGVGKSLRPDPANNELVGVTCQNNTTGTVLAAPNGCSNPPAGTDPIRVTVTVCWRHRGRIIGECAPNGTALQFTDNQGTGPHNVAGVMESPAMLTTLVTCRG